MKYDKDIVVEWFRQNGIRAVPEFRFHSERKWRFDFILQLNAFGNTTIALEVDGGLFIAGGGRHNRGASMLKDFEKLNEAAALGWRIIRVTPDQLCLQDTVDLIKRALNA